MDKRQFTGKTLEEALSEAAKSFSTNKDLLCYNVIQQPSTGLFSRLFSRSIRIEAWVETVKEDLQAAAREVVRQTLVKSNSSKPNLSPVTNTKKDSKETAIKKESYQIQQNEKQSHSLKRQTTRPDTQINRSILNMESAGVEELFDHYNKLFFAAFGISQDNIETIIHDNETVVRVSDPEIEKYLSKSDKLSLAFEHVFKRVAQKKLGDISSRITLDAGESSEKREERLIGMARTLADKVKKTGKSVILSSKSSQERRVIHLALDGFVGVATRSVGTGDKRRLVIYSTEKKQNHKVQNLAQQNNNTNKAPSMDKNDSNSSVPTKFKKRPHKKRNNQNIVTKQNRERVGAFSYNDSSDEEELKNVNVKKNAVLNKEN
ncbi:protein jag [Silvanigrella sp.]|jgi:spoIIIJ-associated protein|uniref:protein jag n=1 Tax=Silvanigrella sp. TaxID=2024976 RepID=UPI0037C674E6